MILGFQGQHAGLDYSGPRFTHENRALGRKRKGGAKRAVRACRLFMVHGLGSMKLARENRVGESG